MELEFEVVSEHGLASHRQIRLDVSLDHLVGNGSFQVLDDAQHVVVAHSGKGHVACEQLAQCATRRPDVDATIYDEVKQPCQPYFSPRIISGAR